MSPKIKKYKWMTAFVLFFALMLTLDIFVNFSGDSLQLFFVSGLVFTLLYLMKTYGKITRRLMLGIVIILALVYGADLALTKYEQFKQQDLVINNQSTALSYEEIYNTVKTRHQVTSLHKFRDFLDYKKGIAFGEWLVNVRIDQHILKREEIQRNSTYEWLFQVLVTFIVGLLMAIIMRIKGLKLLFITPLMLYIWMWYQYMDVAWHITAFYFAGLLSYFILEHHERLLASKTSYNTEQYSGFKLMLTSITLSFALVFISGALTLVFPINTVNRLIDGVTPSLWGARSGYEGNAVKMYSLVDTPFQNIEGTLGGPIRSINSVDALFWVQLDQEVKRGVYLKTSIKDQYDGLRWINNGTVYRNQYKFYKDDPQNLKLLESGLFEKLSGTIRLNKKTVQTVTLFTPMGLYETSLNPARVYVSAENEAFYKAAAFVRYLNTYRFSATQQDFYYPSDLDYLQLPTRIDSKTKSLAQILGEMGETDYEKVVILTQFLTSNYEYTLTPEKHQGSKDFVSTFLFDTQEGYCTYFASSMAVLARLNGIPARYVEGFLVDPSKEDQEGYVKITESNAHAWVEVYLEGYGWIVVESTPPFSEPVNLDAPLTLEELLAEKEDENENQGPVVITPDSGDDTISGRPNMDELLEALEGDVGNYSGAVLTQNEIDTTQSSLKWLNLLFLVPLALLVLFISRLPFGYFRTQNTHAFAVRQLYYLSYLFAESEAFDHFEPEVTLRKMRFAKDEMDLWMKILYDRPVNVSKEDIEHAINSSEKYIKMAKEAYIGYKGRWAYLKMRLFKVHKMIP